jgi:hypothetical protein
MPPITKTGNNVTQLSQSDARSRKRAEAGGSASRPLGRRTAKVRPSRRRRGRVEANSTRSPLAAAMQS